MSAVVMNHPGHRSTSSSDKTDPSASRIPQKTRPTKPPNPKGKPKNTQRKGPEKPAKQATKSAKGKQTKNNHQPRNQDRIAFLFFKIAEEIPSCKLPFRSQVQPTEIGAGVKNPLGCCARVGSCDQPPKALHNVIKMTCRLQTCQRTPKTPENEGHENRPKSQNKAKNQNQGKPPNQKPRKPAKRSQNDPEFADKLVLRLWTSATLYIMVRPMLRGQLTE